jgi:hypothetical protein
MTDTCQGSTASEPHVLELLCAPGLLRSELQRFVKLHPKYRWCASLKHDAHAKWCEQAMARGCSVNAIQFCAVPQEHDTSIAQTWLQAANVPPDVPLAHTFPLLPNAPAHDERDASYVQDSCRAAGEAFSDNPNKSQQHLMAQTRESTALAQYLCLQRGKIQQLVSNERTIVDDNMTSHEKWDRRGYGRVARKVLSTPGRAMNTTSAFGMGNTLAGAAGAAAVGSMTAGLGMGAFGVLAGYQLGTAGHDSVTGGVEGRVRTHLETEARMRALDLRGKQLTSPMDTIIWDCLTRTCNSLRLDSRLKVALGADGVKNNVHGLWSGGIESFFTPASVFVPVSKNGHQWIQMSPRPNTSAAPDAFGASATSLHHPTCTDNNSLMQSSFDKNKEILAHLLKSRPTRTPSGAPFGLAHLLKPGGENDDLFRSWASKDLLTSSTTSNEMWKLIMIDRSLPPPELDHKFVAVAAQPLFVKIGRLISLQQLYTKAQQQLHPASLQDRIDLSTFAKKPDGAPVAPLIKMWYMLNPPSKTTRTQTYLNLDYLWAVAHTTVNSTVAPDLNRTPGGFYEESHKRLQAAEARAARCSNLLAYEND